jgi:hypothetical protein
LERYNGMLFGRDQPGWQSPQSEGSTSGCDNSGDCKWPSRPGQPQYRWEPSRVVGNAHRSRPQEREGQGGPHVQRADSDDRAANSRPTQPSVGGDSHGSTSGLDYAELCISGDNRTDELRLLGNGVVPATATHAFLTLLLDLCPPTYSATPSRPIPLPNS